MKKSKIKTTKKYLKFDYKELFKAIKKKLK